MSTPAASAVRSASVGGLEAFSYVSAIAFATRVDGRVLLARCASGSLQCTVDVATSSDGGLTWSVPRLLTAYTRTDLDAYPDTIAVSKLTFSSATVGFAYGPKLFTTSDGGGSWRELPVTGTVEQVVPVGDRTWLVRSPCAPGLGGWGQCASVIDTVTGAGTVTALAAQPAADGSVVSVVAASPTSAYATVLVNHSSYALRATTDAGASWQAVPVPCATDQAVGDPASLSIAGGRLWLVCAGESGAGSQRKNLFTSDDAGKTWTPQPALETTGYADQIVATSATTAWRVGGRAPLYVTHDAGHTWTAELSGVFSTGATTSAWAFTTAGRAWVVGPGGGYTDHLPALYVRDDAGADWSTVTIINR